LRETFASLRKLSEKAAEFSGHALPELSMGMSGDFEAAIAEGATMVRVGGAIFGPRQN
jgi:PLP dependent protein